MRDNVELGAVLAALALQAVTVWQTRRRKPPKGKHRR